MGQRGGFTHTYNEVPVHRLISSQENNGRLQQRISREVLDSLDVIIHSIAEDVATEYGIVPAAAQLIVAQRVSEATSFLRTVYAGEARAVGLPGRALQDAMGYSSPTSVTRMIPELDHIAGVRARVEQTSTPEPIFDDRGYDIVLHPTGNIESVHQARLRGWMPTESSTTDQ